MNDITHKESFFGGTSGARLLQGLVVGVVATLIIGFGFSNWNLPSAVATKVEVATHDATVAALAPICADRFQKAAAADSSVVPALNAVKSWDRNEHLMKSGFAKFVSSEKPDYMVARKCASLLSLALKLD